VIGFGRGRFWGGPAGGDVGHSVAAVLRDGQAVGAAFLISPDTLLTCAHVVTAALGLPAGAGAPDALVTLEFPLTAPDTRRHAVVVKEAWQPERADESGDIAVLRLVEPRPEGTHPVRLVRSDQLWGHGCRTFGFPNGHGSWFSGELRGEVRSGWWQLVAEGERGYPIERGFSGAPLWDERLHGVVGMAVAFDKDPRRRAGFMIPTRLLPAPPPSPERPGRWRRIFGRPDQPRPDQPRPRRGRLTVALLVLAVAVLVLTALVVVPRLTRGAPDCPLPVRLRVAVSSGGQATYRGVADVYERWTADRNGGCRTASLALYPTAPDLVAEGMPRDPALAKGGARLGDTGLHPDLWLPGASATIQEIRHSESGARITAVPVASSPLVLAVPAGLVEPKRDNAYRPGSQTWATLFHHARTEVGWRVVRPDPATSLVGRLGTVALYSRPLGIPDDAARVRQDIEQSLEQAQDAGPYPPGDDTALLCRQRGPHPAARAAVITTEHALVQFNLGRPLGGGCIEEGGPDAPGRLVGFYPIDTPAVDHYLIQLAWDETVQSPAVRTAAADFASWLSLPAGRAALFAQGLRPAGYFDIDAPLVDANGALPSWPFGHPVSPLSEADRDAALGLYAKAHRPAQVLMAVDTSGSMGTATADGRGTRFEVALDAVQASLARMGGNDEFGLWLFSTEMGGGGTRTVVSMGRRSKAQDDTLANVRSQVVPSGDTPLYRTIDAGIKAVRTSGGTGPGPLRALVVLTDGQDTASRDLRADTSGGTQARVFVIAIGEASCGTAELVRVTRDTGGACFTAAADTVGQTLTTLFRTLWEKGG
jgi:hypothetical protein